DDYTACRAAGLSDAEMRRVLDDHGIQLAELEFLFDWWRSDERGSLARVAEDRLYAMADAFGARHLNVGDIAPKGELAPFALVAERFAALCDRAAAHGLLVAIEFLPWTDIADATAAWEIARLAGRRNGGILVDSWHYFRGGADAARLRAVPAERIFVVQLDDAEADPGGESWEGTLHRRLPGEGTFDLVGLIRLLVDMGVQAPISVEIISPEHPARPLTEAARLAHDTSRAVLARARRERACTTRRPYAT